MNDMVRWKEQLPSAGRVASPVPTVSGAVGAFAAGVVILAGFALALVFAATLAVVMVLATALMILAAIAWRVSPKPTSPSKAIAAAGHAWVAYGRNDHRR